MLRGKVRLITLAILFDANQTILCMAQNKNNGKDRRGFASMPKERQREIASEGGKAAHAKGTAHEFTSEEAREAGRKGGQRRSNNRG
jgi:uncharacterized protein